MTYRTRLFLVCAAACGITGCAVKQTRRATTPAPAPAAEVADAPPADPAMLSLDQIEPRPALLRPAPTTGPTTAPSELDRPPIEALYLYAQARDCLLNGRRYTAISLLDKAIALDPDSYELHYALGQAYQMGRTFDERSIEAMERAAAIDPDHLDLQTDLGRQYLAKGDLPRATEHLRLALQTRQYATDESAAAVADYFLARALQSQGYDRAALEQYAKLLGRAKDRPLALRHDPHLAFIVSDRLQVDVGDLYAKRGLHHLALPLFESAAARDPDNLERQSRVVRSLGALGRHEQATALALDLVARLRAGAEAVALLREAHRAAGDEPGAAAAAALRRLHDQRPGDRDMLSALVDLLAAAGRADEADELLARAAERGDGGADAELLRRRFDLRAGAGDVEGAARFLIETVARRPDLAAELDPVWGELLRPAREATLRLPALQSLPVPPALEAAKAYAVSRVAARTFRERAARNALERAVTFSPPFAPAYRDFLDQLWTRADADEAEKLRRTQTLIDAASAAGDAALAEELNGLSLLHQEKPAEAAEALGRAIALGAMAPEPHHARATASRPAGNPEEFEQLLWKLVSDRPAYEGAYLDLYEYYSDEGQVARAERVLTAWQSALPRSPAARLRQAAADYRAGRLVQAEKLLLDLAAEHGDQPAVLSALRAFYARTGQPERFVAALEERQPGEPGNLAAAAMLADVYAQQQRPADAARVLDAARASVGGDADLLYQLAHAYHRAGLGEAGESVLADVLRLDPSHAPAANDLGYRLAEQGRDLARAEDLARLAVAAEPHNGAYLDSLGWVLYKRGKFAEARGLLDRAAAASSPADPVVLDHLADATYRLGEAAAATALWGRALERLEETGAASRPDLKELRQSLRRKTRQAAEGGAVEVAPVAAADDPPPPRQLPPVPRQANNHQK